MKVPPLIPVVRLATRTIGVNELMTFRVCSTFVVVAACRLMSTFYRRLLLIFVTRCRLTRNLL